MNPSAKVSNLESMTSCGSSGGDTMTHQRPDKQDEMSSSSCFFAHELKGMLRNGSLLTLLLNKNPLTVIDIEFNDVTTKIHLKLCCPIVLFGFM